MIQETFSLLILLSVLQDAAALSSIKGSCGRSNIRSASLLAASSSWLPEDDWSRLSDQEETRITEDDVSERNLAAHMRRRHVQDHHVPLSEEDQWLSDVIEDMHAPPIEPGGVALYDTGVETPSFEDDMDAEIAMLVRCNERPEAFLVAGGRALPELTEAERKDVWQLVETEKKGGAESITLKPSIFLKESVKVLFEASCAPGQDVLDNHALARWMTRCLPKERPTGPHDKRIGVMTSKYSSVKKSGVLTLADFENLYFDTLVGPAGSMTFDGKQQAENHLARQSEIIDAVWRDFENHGIVSPVVFERQLLQDEIRAKYGTFEVTSSEYDLMDECEILDWGLPTGSPSNSAKKDMVDSITVKSQSSHKRLEMTNDGDKSVPVWVKDGQFIFIDEESCIGCMQCANASPSSFLMLENGRARAFQQRSSPDVDEAVASCPVSCMHRVSFRELTEFETARDEGDGRTDHRHLGHKRGVTPLHVAGMDSDSNHRSSWYHTLKHRCLMSSQCPQKGCYDCPQFSQPGMNPYFKENIKKTNHIRAQHFIESGAADVWRKTVEL